MLYTCTIYSHAYTFGGTSGFTGTEPAFEAPLAHVVVAGRNLRDAAARAYVQCVGQKRAKQMREMNAPREVIKQETSRKAIAASLRKTAQRIGECFEMDNFVESWFIKVEPAPAHLQPSRPRSLRLPSSLLIHLSSIPSPN